MREVIERLAREQPRFHGDGTKAWAAPPDTLGLIARFLAPGQHTLETGTGASTVVFAASGARHTAISPAPEEHERICAWYHQAGIDTSRVELHTSASSESPALREGPPLDVVLIDGLHA